MDFVSFITQGIVGEFYFEREGGFDRNNIDVGDAKALRVSAKDAGKRKQVGDSYMKNPKQKHWRVPPQVNTAVGNAFDPLDVDSDPEFHEFPAAKELKEYSYCHYVVKHITPLSWNKASCDELRERETAKDKAYSDLEKKCNEALQDLEKYPLVLNMCVEISTLQSEVERMQSEYSLLVLEEKKWDIDSWKHDRVAVASKVIPHVAQKLVHSDEIGVLVAKLMKAAIFQGRCEAFKEVAKLEEPFDRSKIDNIK
nr:hypothetical protein [Tanacetum cinerariifolium]